MLWAWHLNFWLWGSHGRKCYEVNQALFGYQGFGHGVKRGKGGNARLRWALGPSGNAVISYYQTVWWNIWDSSVQVPLLHLLIRPHFLSSRPELWPFDPSRKPITYSRQPNCLKFNLRHSFVPLSRDGPRFMQRGPVLLQANGQLWNWNAAFCARSTGQLMIFIWSQWLKEKVIQFEILTNTWYCKRSMHLKCRFPITWSGVMWQSSVVIAQPNWILTFN